MLYIIDVHIFSQEDIALNTKTLGWPVKIRPVFEQNTEIVEDCKARFEDNLQKKSEWTSRELEKLSTRVQELEELGEIANVQQYTYEVRMVQNKLKSIEDTICWINQVIILFHCSFLYEGYALQCIFFFKIGRSFVQVSPVILSRCWRYEYNSKWRG